MNLVTILRRVAIVLAFVLGHPEKIRHLRRGRSTSTWWHRGRWSKIPPDPADSLA